MSGLVVGNLVELHYLLGTVETVVGIAQMTGLSLAIAKSFMVF